MRRQNTSSWVEHNRAIIFLSLLIISMFAIIELKHPYFFLQDDNLQQNLPLYVHNFRSLVSGEFPLFNFHQFLGTPVFSCIQSAALYPPNYIALLLSKLFFGHYFASMEFIALFHLVVAGLGFFRFMRTFELSRWSCCFGALTWAFCSFVITVGHSWIQVVGYAAYFPWILLFSLKLMVHFTPQNFAILVGLRIIDLCLGYPPYFIYTVTFDLLAVTILYFAATQHKIQEDTGSTNNQHTKCSFSAFISRQTINIMCVIIISAPLLLPALHQIGISADRKSPLGWQQYSQFNSTLSYWLNGLFSPFSGMQLTSWAPQPLQFIPHIGWLTLFFCVAAFFLRHKHLKVVYVFSILALISLLWANDTFITKMMHFIPIYNQQRWPFKLIFFTSFFLIVIAVFGLDAVNQRIKHSSTMRSTLFSILFLAQICNLLMLYTVAPKGLLLFQEHPPPYTEPLYGKLESGRIVSIVAPNGSTMGKTGTLEQYHDLLGFNFSTLFELYHFAGYEVLISERNLQTSFGLNYDAYITAGSDGLFSPTTEDLYYLRKWGVQWYVIAPSAQINKSSSLLLVHRDANRSLYFDAAAKPFVYWLDSSDTGGIEHNLTTNSIIARTEQAKTGRLLVNVLYNSFFQATVDGIETNITETTDRQMLVTVPPGKHTVKLTYTDPYFTAGVYISFGFVLLVGGICLKYGVKQKRVHQAMIRHKHVL